MEKQSQLRLSLAANVIQLILIVGLGWYFLSSSGSSKSKETVAPGTAFRLPPITTDGKCLAITATDALLIIDVQNDFMPERPLTVPLPEGVNKADALLNDTTIKEGSLKVPEAKDIVSHINPLIQTFEAAKGTIIYSLDWHPTGHCSYDPKNTISPADPTDPTVCRDDTSLRLLNSKNLMRWPAHCTQGSWGARFDPHLTLSPNASVVKKGFWPHFDSYSAFGGRVSSHSAPISQARVDEDMRLATRRIQEVLLEKGVKRLFVVGIATDYCVRQSLEDSLMSVASGELSSLQVATIKEAIGAVFPENKDGLFKAWEAKGITVLSENNAQGKPLLNSTC